MEKGVAVVFALVLVFGAVAFVPGALAADGQIKVYTLPEHDVSILILNGGDQYGLRESYHNLVTDANGVVSVDYSQESPFKLRVFVRKNNIELFDESFGPYDSEVLIEVELPEGIRSGLNQGAEEDVKEENSTETEEESLETTEEVTTEENVPEAQTTGLAVEGEGGFKLSKIFYYVIGAIIVFGIIGFVAGRALLARKKGWVGAPAEPVRINKGKMKDDGNWKKELSDAESELKKAQSEIRKIKDKERIAELEEKLKRDREDLDRMRRE